jgi:hypothetical protein
LAQRIQQFLQELGRQGRGPNRLEAHYLLDALSYLHAAQWVIGEEAMRRAERAAEAEPERLSSVRPVYDPVTVSGLRDQLQIIMARYGEALVD